MFHPGSSTGQVAPPQAAAVPLVSPKNVPGAYSVLVVSLCPVVVEEPGILLVNRKFHTGMQEFARRLPGRIACLVPEIRLGPGVFTMDSVRERAADLPYTVHVAPDGRAAAAPLIADLVGRSAVAQVSEAEWLNLDTARACRAAGVPYVVLTEYTLRAELDTIRAQTQGLARTAYRVARLLARWPERLGLLAAAAEAHANGFPTYLREATRAHGRILFFDTRARADDVISTEELSQRLASRPGRRARFIYSGRYEPMKGTLDVVRAGLLLARSREDFELDLYGAGSLATEMRAMASRAGAAGTRIRVHDVVPYPELVRITRQADLFIECHVQGDPSCTYLETLACGVPILGYQNEAWSPLARDSAAGVSVRRSPAAMAAAMAGALARPASVDEMSRRARSFALLHTMEEAWDQRTARLRALLAARELRAR